MSIGRGEWISTKLNCFPSFQRFQVVAFRVAAVSRIGLDFGFSVSTVNNDNGRLYCLCTGLQIMGDLQVLLDPDVGFKHISHGIVATGGTPN